MRASKSPRGKPRGPRDLGVRDRRGLGPRPVTPAVARLLQGKQLRERHAADAGNEGPPGRIPVEFVGDLDTPLIELEGELAVASVPRRFAPSSLRRIP